jgi:hypothetical protein
MIDSLNRIMFDSFIKGFDGFGYWKWKMIKKLFYDF